MYSKWLLAKKYLHYYLTASNGKGHGMHSPFVFDFITRLLNDRKDYPAYNTVEQLRQQLLKDESVLTIEDFGAGSSVSKTNQRTIGSIAKNAAKPKKYGQLLFRMVNVYQPTNILELGTSLGITSSYLSLANPAANVITMEGANEVATVAKKNFQQSGLGNIYIEQGDFTHTLPAVLERIGKTEKKSVDFAFIDGNHRKEPTIDYFQWLLPYINNDSIIIFDDIHWSSGMEAAWETIKAHPSVRCSLDLFFIGIILFRQEFREKQDFVIRF